MPVLFNLLILFAHTHTRGNYGARIGEYLESVLAKGLGAMSEFDNRDWRF